MLKIVVQITDNHIKRLYLDTLMSKNNERTKTALKQVSEIKKELLRVLYIFLRYIKNKTKFETLLYKLYNKISHLLVNIILSYNSG